MMRMGSVLLCLGTAVALTGCTAIVKPRVHEADFLTVATKASGRADLYVSEEFRRHTERKVDVMDLKKWQFELGPVATDMFKYALGGQFETVEVKLGSPSFPIPEADAKDLLLAVEPAFAGFKSHCPFVFKFETYVVKVSFRVKAYDRSGSLVLDKTYEGVGRKRGAIGYDSAGHAANPVAAELAIKDAVNQAVTDIVQAINK